MRNAVLLLAAIGVGQCADFWLTKAPDAWTEKEAATIRRKSPWAKQEPLERQTLETTTQTKGGGKKAPPRTTTKQRRVWARAGELQFRWESAAPVLAATARFDPRAQRALEQLASEYYVVSVSGPALHAESVEAMTEDIRLHSTLHFGERSAHPRVVRAIDAAEGLRFLLEFPRRLELESEAKGIELRMHLGVGRAQASFEPKHMIFQGKPAL